MRSTGPILHCAASAKISGGDVCEDKKKYTRVKNPMDVAICIGNYVTVSCAYGKNFFEKLNVPREDLCNFLLDSYV